MNSEEELSDLQIGLELLKEEKKPPKVVPKVTYKRIKQKFKKKLTAKSKLFRKYERAKKKRREEHRKKHPRKERVAGTRISFDKAIEERFRYLFSISDEVIITKQWLKQFWLMAQRAFHQPEFYDETQLVNPKCLTALEFSIKEVADLCQVKITQVASWIERNTLKGYLLPGVRSKYRIPKDNLVEFMRENNIPYLHLLAYIEEPNDNNPRISSGTGTALRTGCF